MLKEDNSNVNLIVTKIIRKKAGNSGLYAIPKPENIVEYFKKIIMDSNESTNEIARIMMEIGQVDKETLKSLSKTEN